MAGEMLDVFYKHNHFIAKCVDIPVLTNFASCELSTVPLLYPRSCIMHLTVMVPCVEVNHIDAVHLNSDLRLLLMWERLRTAIIEIRGSYKAVGELCERVIDVAGTCDSLKKKLGPGLRVRVTGQPKGGSRYVHTKADITGLWSPPAKLEWHPALSAEENELWWHVTNTRNIASTSIDGLILGWYKEERERVLGKVQEFYGLKRRFYMYPKKMEITRETTEGFMKSDPDAVIEAYADGDIPSREAKLRFSHAGKMFL